MKRTKLSDRELPSYTKGEEIFNMVTHIVGGAVGIVALVLCVIMAAIHHNVMGVVSSSIYGATMILLYTFSSIYHGLKPKLTAKKVFQIIDHCSIFLLIAGTYTPITLCALREFSAPLGWTLFSIVWGVAILGITFNAIDLKAFRKFSAICYLAMGWCIVAAYKALPFLIEKGGTLFLLLGGVCYTIGAVFYYLLKSKKYMHSVFHIFVVIGSLLHMFYIMLYVVV